MCEWQPLSLCLVRGMFFYLARFFSLITSFCLGCQRFLGTGPIFPLQPACYSLLNSALCYFTFFLAFSQHSWWGIERGFVHPFFHFLSVLNVFQDIETFPEWAGWLLFHLGGESLPK
jgi:hypothetical protein